MFGARILSHRLSRRTIAVGCFALLPLAGFGEEAVSGTATGAFRLESPSFAPGGEIPREHTCEGRNVSPPLAWSRIPEGTESLALIVDDPDAPDPRAPRTRWVHWVIYNLPPTATRLQEAVTASDLPAGAREGLNDWKRAGYGGPCPPIGRHRYFHRLYALDRALPDLGTPTRTALERAMEGNVLAEALLIGTYQKQR